MNRIYLAVPFVEKDEAKSFGAKWDGECKKWYCENNYKNYKVLLEKWKINDTPIELIGEDREFGGNTLFIDLVPSTCWFSNVRSCIHPKDWDRVRNHIYERTNYTCECCGINTKEDTTNGQLEAHERWNYDEEKKIQKLMRIIALCHQCHQSTHMGLAGLRGKDEEAMTHLQKVKNITQSEACKERNESGILHRIMSQHEWKLDISLITNNGIETVTPDVVNKRIIANNYEERNDICNGCSKIFENGVGLIKYRTRKQMPNYTTIRPTLKCNECYNIETAEILTILPNDITKEEEFDINKNCDECYRYFKDGIGIIDYIAFKNQTVTENGNLSVKHEIARISCIECCNKIYKPEEIKLLTNNDTVYCGNCKCYLPKTDFHGSTLRLSNIKICNKCRKTIKENIKISNEKKTKELQYSCKSCKKYFENGNGLIRFRFTHYVDCKKYKLEQSRCDGCYRKGNYEDSQIISTGGKIGDIPDQQLYL